MESNASTKVIVLETSFMLAGNSKQCEAISQHPKELTIVSNSAEGPGITRCLNNAL